MKQSGDVGGISLNTGLGGLNYFVFEEQIPRHSRADIKNSEQMAFVHYFEGMQERLGHRMRSRGVPGAAAGERHRRIRRRCRWRIWSIFVYQRD